MLSSSTFWYSGVSGACWPGPQGLVGSKVTRWPPRPGVMIRFHWPFQLGYFASSACAAPSVMVSAVAIAMAELRSGMLFLLALPVAAATDAAVMQGNRDGKSCPGLRYYVGVHAPRAAMVPSRGAL